MSCAARSGPNAASGSWNRKLRLRSFWPRRLREGGYLKNRSLQAGDVIADHYHIEAPLGGGGMGEVYLARDARLDRPVAVKVMRADVALQPEAEARFLREARMLSRVAHPNIVAIYDFGRVAAGPFVVMEYVEGDNLEQRLASAGPLGLAEVADVTAQIASGLAELHALGLVHRDVKPGNILLRRLTSGSFLAKLVDFGLTRDIAVAPTDVVTRSVALLGTPDYMAPEQIEGLTIDGRSDLYALAIVVYQMLTGARPYHRETMQDTLRAHLVERPPPILRLLSDGIELHGIERVVHRALAKKPTDRQASVVVFAQELAASIDWVCDDQVGDVACPCCNHPARSGRYCQQCGAAVPVTVCRACRTPHDTQAFACSNCAASLLPERPAERQSFRLTSVTAAALVVRCSAIEAAEALFAQVLTCVEEAGGRVVAALGTEVVALFGIGGVREQEVVAALDAGLALQRSATARWTDGSVSVGVGIEVGRMVSRGSALMSGMVLATGEAVEAARSTAALCPPGQVYVGPSAFRETRAVFQTLPTAGTNRRIVLARRDAALALVDYAQDAQDAPLVGREDDVAQLLRVARKVRRLGQLHVVPVMGPRSAGKTRLLHELLCQLDDEVDPWQVDLGRCTALGIPIAYEPFVGILRARLRAHEVQRDGALTDRLAQLPGLDEGDANRLHHRVAALGRLLGLQDSHAGSARPATQAEQHAAFDAYVALLRGACARSPLVLIVEDLQWAREGTLQLLAHILRGCDDLPVLVLLPVRTDRAESVLAALTMPTGRQQPIEVAPLDVAEIALLVKCLRPGAIVPAAVVDVIAALSEGVAGQVEELLDVMTEDGIFEATADGWRLCSDRIADAGLVHLLADAVMRRIGRLAPADRALVDAIAVAGSHAPRGMIEAVLQRPVAESELEHVKRAGLVVEIRQTRFLGEREFALKRAEFAAVVAKALPLDELRAAHRRAARWLLAWTGPRPLGIGAMLAHCYMAAGEGEQAVRHLTQEAEAAMRALANRDAFETFRAAAEVACDWHGQAGAGDEAREAWTKVLLGQADTGLLLGEHEAVVAATQQVIALSADSEGGRLLAKTRALTLLGEALRNMGHHDAALQALRDAIHTARDVADADLWGLRAHVSLSAVHMRRGDYDEAERVASVALEARLGPAATSEEQSAMGRLHTWIGHAASHRGNFDRARAAYTSARDCFSMAQDDVAMAMADLSIGNLIYRMGDPDRAADAYRRVVEICRPMEYMHGCAVAEVNLGHVLLDQHRYREAIEVLRRAEQTIRRLGSLDSLPEALRLIALASLRCGDAHSAQRVAAEALELAETMGNSQMASSARMVRDEAAQVAASLSATTFGATQ